MRSANHLKQIGIALQAYHDAYGRLPPAVVRDQYGQPLYSWRVLILPYVEAGDLYQRFRLDEPWDSPHNRPLLSQMPGYYAAPLPDGVEAEPGTTFYQVFVGRGTAFDSDEGNRLPDDFPDGTANTLTVVEA